MKRECSDDFTTYWRTWYLAITEYSLAVNNPAKGLRRALKDLPIPDEESTLTNPQGVQEGECFP